MPETPAGNRIAARGAVLAFDFGLARIGIATGELETRTASPLLTLAHSPVDVRFATIAKLLAEWQPVMLVCGRPLGLDGEADAMTQHCARFANQLRGRFKLPVVEVDERLSSLAAEQLLVASGQRDWRRRKDRLDAVAACVILQTYLDGLPHEAQI